MSESKKSLLIAKINRNLKLEQMNEIHEYLKYHLENLGIDLLVVDDKVEPQFHQPISELVEAIKNQTEAINNLVGSNIAILDELLAQGEAEPNELDDDLLTNPQSLD
ncbi:TPA: hypothetical protein NIK62_000156 [Vibrio cholerae]|uniref:hypothetical protein n=1 Tax=Vibrio cholerae TaxID=666 RepID=UPI0006A47D30|nr:hypothetical protein [Vibrio cholerae]EGR0073188.1 hypothetical protein [Vibrio cholerae]EJL6764594.1 hypothetical protein [Vibrio cholerae]EJL6959326.1 hypothetical protein [Vibrio cholerae]EKF9465822.1 hypothetical protein [Vibrio cholerae]EMC8696584.1 hypothetical protein [Vibrio cholerae]